MIVVSLNVGGGVRLIKPANLCMCTQNTTNTTRTDARRRVCAAIVPYRRATRGTSLRELEYIHTHAHAHTHTLLRTIFTRGKSVMTSLIPSAEKGALSRGGFFLIRERLKGVETTHILVWLLVFCVIEENEPEWKTNILWKKSL